MQIIMQADNNLLSERHFHRLHFSITGTQNDKHWGSNYRQRNLTHVLHRPVEATAQGRH